MAWEPPPLDPSWDKKPNADGKVEIKLSRKTRKKFERNRLPGETDDEVLERTFADTERTETARYPFARPGSLPEITRTLEHELRQMPVMASTSALPIGEKPRSATLAMSALLDGLPTAQRHAILGQVGKHFTDVDGLKSGHARLVLSRGILSDVVDGKAKADVADYQRVIDNAADAMPPGPKQDSIRHLRSLDPVAGSRIAVKILDARLAELEHNIAPMRAEISLLERRQGALSHLLEMAKAPQLQKLGETGFHKLLEAFRRRDIILPHKQEIFPQHLTECLNSNSPTFVIQHNWAQAFDKADQFEAGEWRLGYDETIFEFRISGSRVIVGVATHDDFTPSTAVMCVETPVGWTLTAVYTLAHGKWSCTKDHDDADPIFAVCVAQIRAVSIALSAKVAETDVVRAPAKLNKKRELKGRLPILDYHVINLARRTRPAPLPSDAERGTHASPRLHFRRGHWRHFEHHRTWIEWMLVGDPELGFVDKHYRL